MRFHEFLFRSAPISILVASGCGADGPAEATPRVPAAMSAISAQEQEGVTGLRLPEPLVVQVTDARGNPLGGVSVAWQLKLGGGDLSSPVTTTGGEGLASVRFRPTVAGTSTVEAAVVGSTSRAALPPVTFTVEVTDAVLIRLAYLFQCSPPDGFVSDDQGSNETAVPVGAIVAWTIAEEAPLSCEARILSTRAPEGGEPFDSGVLRKGEIFRFAPAVPGTWEYIDEVTGAPGTLTAK